MAHNLGLSDARSRILFKDGNAFTKNVLSNWEIAPVYTYQSGQWMTAQDGVDANLNGDSAGDRPIFDPSGAGLTGSGVAPLCRSNIPAADCILANVTSFAAIDPNAGVTYDVADLYIQTMLLATPH